MTRVAVEGLRTRFGPLVAVDDVSFELDAGHVLAVLGPSGCGKTTLLRTLAGLEDPERGTITLDDRIVCEPGRRPVPAEHRGIGFVFQDYALFPHLTVAHNVGYGVRDHRRRELRVSETLELVGLAGLEHRYPHELSGGQQQRVALARALAPEPAVVLLDEPFSNLDADLRARVRVEVRRIFEAAGATAIFVTHDQDEAFEIADRVAVMCDGRFEQMGTAEEIYHTPANRFVADFVGQASFVDAFVSEGRLACELGVFEAPNVAEGAVELLVRPEDIELSTPGRSTIVWRRFQGDANLYMVRLPSEREVLVVGSSKTAYAPGMAVHARFEPDHLVVFREDERIAWSPVTATTGTDPTPPTTS